MLDEIILFGAGFEATRIIEMLDAINCNVIFCVDNDEKKINTDIKGIKIYNPMKLKEYKASIYVTPIVEDQIISQLIEMGLEKRVISKEKFFDEYLKELDKHIKGNVTNKNINDKKAILFDDMEGVGWGGIERWNKMLVKETEKLNYESLILSSTKLIKNSQVQLEYEMSKLSFLDSIKMIFNIITNNLPICIVNNWDRHVMIAACLAKKYFPEHIKIISGVHSDDDVMLTRKITYKKYFNYFLCVSSKLALKMFNEYNIPKDKIFHKPNFVEFDFKFQKEHNSNDLIRLGYAGRLEKYAKRADKIVDLIKVLERENIIYKLEIAGLGEYFEILKKFINSKGLQDKIFLRGFLAKDDMINFWRRQDIVISLSDFEGMSLSMLEGMAEGAVPVVTNVSGVSDIINNDNGYIVEIDDIETIVRYIKLLNEDRNMLKYMSDNARQAVKEKCSKEEYAKFLLEIAFKE